jgi:hypothetical protein
MNRKIIFLLVLLAALSFAGYIYLPRLIRPAPVQRSALTALPASVVAPASAGSSETAAKQLPAFDEIVVPTEEAKIIDPFSLRIEVLPRVAEPAEPAADSLSVKPVEPQLEGIWIGPNMRIAFISGQAASIGGEIMGWRVSVINKESVILQKGLQTKLLKVE